MDNKFNLKPQNTSPEDPSRRKFLKNVGLTALGLLVGADKLKALDVTKNTIEKPAIVSRDAWDDLNNQISSQYSKKLGEKFTVTINGTAYEKKVDVLPYLNENLKPLDLKEVLRRCVIHHTDVIPVGDAKNQARDVRNLEVGQMGLNDIAYQYLIASDGTILEGRPSTRVGSHAGITKESSEYVKKYLPNGVSDIANSTGEQYYKNLRNYINAMKMDPDYGSMGIVLCGNFDEGGEPTVEQRNSLTNLLNWVKGEYDIPTQNIIYHKEVKPKVIEASGLTFGGKAETVCPGHSFPDLKDVCQKLEPDTPNSKTKTILLDKFE